MVIREKKKLFPVFSSFFSKEISGPPGGIGTSLSKVAVAVSSKNSVLVFDSKNWKNVFEIGHLDSPTDVTFMGQDLLLVADTKHVRMFNATTGEKKPSFLKKNFTSIEALEYDIKKGHLYVADSNEIFVFDGKSGNLVDRWKNVVGSQFSPSFMSMDETSGLLYVSCSECDYADSVYVLNGNGTLVQTIGKRGCEDNEFQKLKGNYRQYSDMTNVFFLPKKDWLCMEMFWSLLMLQVEFLKDSI